MLKVDFSSWNQSRKLFKKIALAAKHPRTEV